MATVTADKVANTVTRRVAPNGETVVVSSYTVPATGDGTAADDVIQMVKVPKGAYITDVALSATDVDTDVSPAHDMTVGDTDGTDDADRYITTSTIGQGGGVARLNNQAGFGYQFEADGTIDITVTTAAATKAAGTFKLLVRYTTEL